MATTLLSVFQNPSFQAAELTNQISQIKPVPTLLGTLGEELFTTIRVRTRDVAIWRRDNIRRLVPISPIGAPPVQLERVGGKFDTFRTHRMAKATTLYAEELQGVLQMPDMQAVQSMAEEVAQRSQAIRDDIELTHEHHRFGCLFGKTLDADGTTVINNWFTEWGITEPAAWNLHLDVPTTNIREIADQIVTDIRKKGLGAWVTGRTRVYALCGDQLFKNLINHPTVVETYMGYAAAAELRGPIPNVFNYGGINWIRFEGETDYDLSIPTNQCRFFPVGANEVFQRALAPAEFNPYINTLGQEIYALNMPDTKRGAYVEVEQYSYPLYMCLRPEMLSGGVMQ